MSPFPVLCFSTRVTLEALMFLSGPRGSSPPEVVLPLPDWQPTMHPGSLEEVGPLVEHVYEVRRGSDTGDELIAQMLIRLPVMSLPS